MRKIAIMLTALFLTTGFATASHAFVPIHKRRVTQQKRIYYGIRSGQVTPREARRLRKEQARIAVSIHRFRSDGHYTPRERVRTRKMLNRSSRHIYRLKHNGRHR